MNITHLQVLKTTKPNFGKVHIIIFHKTPIFKYFIKLVFSSINNRSEHSYMLTNSAKIKA